MPRYKVAHVREQGIDLIIVPLESIFHNQTPAKQNEFIKLMQLKSNEAGLKGTVIPIWTHGNNTHFIAKKNWHPFFKSISYDFVLANLNREVFW